MSVPNPFRNLLITAEFIPELLLFDSANAIKKAYNTPYD